MYSELRIFIIMYGKDADIMRIYWSLGNLIQTGHLNSSDFEIILLILLSTGGTVGVFSPKKTPHLVNLNEDPFMSECLVSENQCDTLYDGTNIDELLPFV